MAKEHHCPNCGAQPCNASTSKIHTCGVCAAIWEEDLSVPTPASTPPRPAPTPAAAAPSPTAPKPAAPAASAPKPAPTPPAAPPAAATPAAPSPTAAAPAAPAPVPAPPRPAPVATPAPAAPAKPVHAPSAGGGKTLADVLGGATVRRCPACQSDGVAQPSDFTAVNGRLVLVDSQTYRAHRWYADTGELLPNVAMPAPAAAPAAPAAPVAAARTNPAP